ncbi:MAG: carbohydrate porin [Legionella sp.]|nr:carbohydrate porin [Legionella sp.]
MTLSMGFLHIKSTKPAVLEIIQLCSVKTWFGILTIAIFILSAKSAVADEALARKHPLIVPSASFAYNWTGLYSGGHLGYAWGHSSWVTEQGMSGSLNLAKPINSFYESGSFFAGVQSGYNYMFPNRLVAGAEVDASFPSWPTLSGITIGGTQTFISPTLGTTLSYSETVLSFGTVRGRIGYAPRSWLFYVTGGFAWTYNQQILTQLVSGVTEIPSLWRLGWAVGAGVEAPVLPHWTAKFEYLLTNYGKKSVGFLNAGQQINSNFLLQELRVGINYQFDNAATTAFALGNADNLSFHGQTTYVLQGYPAIRSPYAGINSLPRGGQARSAGDATLFAGLKLWQDTELWVNPELDQGFGIANTHGLAGYPSAESYKLGSSTPYARVQRYFIRQTIDLGGKTSDVDAGINHFAGTQTANNLILTLGRFYIVDLFDTNIYANNPKSDFLNWSVINAGSFDYAGDAWGSTYGAAIEWYQNRFTLRGGIFDMSVVPAGGGNSKAGYALDPTFGQFQLVGEIEERHELWNQPGKFKVTAFLIRGRTGNFRDAIALSQATDLNVSDALAAVRIYSSLPGINFNLEQQVTETVGVFVRAGWADGNLESWDVTDIDRTFEGGVSITGNQWGRPDDTVGIAGVINSISSVHEAYFNAGGLGILIGDGKLPNPGLEKIIEAYYSYTLSLSTKLSFDYQYIINPAYNTNRGPVNVFGGRFHWQF